MSKYPPYVVVSDVHAHSWSQFSKTGPDGVNTRLATILAELRRAAAEVIKVGGNRMRVAGDLFHVRGKIEPSVFNPTFDAFEEISKMGVTVDIIPGNHDLEGANADQLGNSMQQLSRVEGVNVITEPYVGEDVVMLPWIESLDELRAVAISLADKDKDLIIHAPLNGVIKGLPDHGLTPEECAAWGFYRVFVGHYHNHKVFEAGKVLSVGATTHQTWSDPGSAAGFLIVTTEEVTHHETLAPMFVNIDNVGDIDPMTVGGHYVRLRLQDATKEDLDAAHQALEANGALDWVDHSSKKRDSARPVSVATKNVSLEVSVVSYVKSNLASGNLDKRRIAVEALAVLTEARAVGNE